MTVESLPLASIPAMRRPGRRDVAIPPDDRLPPVRELRPDAGADAETPPFAYVPPAEGWPRVFPGL